VIGLPWERIHDEACRWEHVMSEEVERKLLDLLSDPTISPFGMPVPGLELLGHAGSQNISVKALTELDPGEYLLLRIGEPLQIDSQFLIQLKELELIPGETVLVTRNNEGWFLSNKNLTEGLVVDNHVAQHLFLGQPQEK
jgi:DtxR family Mn-dependent transcriptional regulator